jgi:spore maturation protein CgeB
MASCNMMLNYSFSEDMNFRIFEALGMGNILVTDIVPDIFKIIDLSKKMYLFKTIEGADALINNILKNKVEVNLEDNIKYISENHTLKNRVNQILTMIKSNYQLVFL